MQGEECGDQGWTPKRTGKPPPNQEDQEGVERVPAHILPVHRPRRYAEEVAVQHVGDRGEGVPVAGVDRGGDPRERNGPHAPVDHGRVFDVSVVVEIDELAFAGVAKCGRGHGDQSQAEPKCRREAAHGGGIGLAAVTVREGRGEFRFACGRIGPLFSTFE